MHNNASLEREGPLNNEQLYNIKICRWGWVGWVGLVEETIIEIKATYVVHSSFLNEYAVV